MRRGLAALILAAFVAACEPAREPVPTADLPVGRPDLPTPDQVVENGEHLITTDGVKKALLTAEQLYFYDQEGKVYGDTIVVNFFDASGAYVSQLTARTGELDQATQDMVVTGSVFVRGRDATIQTEELHYDPQANRIYSEVPTVINQQGNTIRGRGVESDPSLEQIRIRGGSAVLRSEPGGDRTPAQPAETASDRARREAATAEAAARDST